MENSIFINSLPVGEKLTDADLSLYHMTHIENIESILREGYLYSNHAMRNERLATCYEGGCCLDNERSERPSGIVGYLLGDFVVFFYATRTKMLAAIANGYSEYAKSEDEIVYLVSNLKRVREYTTNNGVRWEASGRNCLSITPSISADNDFGTSNLADALPLQEINFEYPQYQSKNEKSKRMAEFHFLDKMPLDLIDAFAVKNEVVKERVGQIMGKVGKYKDVLVRPKWYCKP